MEERPVNHPDLSDHRGPASLSWVRAIPGLYSDSGWICLAFYACLLMCVHRNGRPLWIYNRVWSGAPQDQRERAGQTVHLGFRSSTVRVILFGGGGEETEEGSL